MKKRIGFIGLGIMGRPMSLNLIRAGYDVSVYDINQTAVMSLADAGARGAASPKEVAEHSDVIFTILPNSEHVRSVITSEQGVLAGANTGSIIIDMSSISPVVSKELAQLVSQSGLYMLDAPVSGGEPKAIDGTLAIMVGGNEMIFESVKEILQVVGQDVTRVGDNGSGATAKLANQIIVNLNIAAMSEALVFAAKAGIDVEKMYQAIRSGLLEVRYWMRKCHSFWIVTLSLADGSILTSKT